jgi:aspartate carbamoyltransferase catalytic subunit
VVDQVRNGVAVRMAVLFKLLGSGTALTEDVGTRG